MNSTKLKLIFTVWTVASAGMSLFAADTILFNHNVQNGGKFGNGPIYLDSGITYPGTGGTNTLNWEPEAGSYKSGGLEFYGGKIMTVPTGVTNLEYTFYVDSTGGSLMNGFTVNLDTGSFNMGTDSWTLDGNPGAVGDVVGQTWHTIDVDLTSIAGFSAGTSQLNGLVAFKNNSDRSNVFIGDIRLTQAIPEPSSLLLIVAACGLVLYIRRKN